MSADAVTISPEEAAAIMATIEAGRATTPVPAAAAAAAAPSIKKERQAVQKRQKETKKRAWFAKKYTDILKEKLMEVVKEYVEGQYAKYAEENPEDGDEENGQPCWGGDMFFETLDEDAKALAEAAETKVFFAPL